MSSNPPLTFRHPDRYRIACALARADDGAAFGPLGRALDLGNNELAHHLRLLQRAGLIERDHPPGRMRPTILTLTSSGRAALAQHGAVLARLAAEADMAP
ncbi:helix-turn-helix domain-containing protein [Bradyrhizobium sp. SZCCHNS1054]|uniref:helix-turn-helix domain-containing protein n=1 Tax=Bradyrhizobium sp. SZCCHNS1054 TaxID=3057301 RepID=UPI003966EE98